MRDDIYDAMARHEDHHWWFQGRRKVLRSLVEGLHLPKKAEILEVGAGTGGNMALLADFGTVMALEPNPKGQQYLRQKTKNPIVGGFLPDTSELEGKTFDLIVLFDVLEHIEDDRMVLESLKQHLKPGGRILLTVPAYPFLWSSHDEAHHHFRRYTTQSVKRVFAQAGLPAQRVSHFNATLFPVIASVRLLQKALGKGGQDQDRVPPAPLNTLLATIFGAESKALRHFNLPFGVSIAAISQPHQP